MQKETAEKEASNVRNAWLVYHDCSEGHPLCLISQGTSHGRDNSTTLLSGALRFSITSMHPLSWERETPIQTREKGEANKQWSMIYEHFSGSLPASLLVMVGEGGGGGVNNADSSEGEHVPPPSSTCLLAQRSICADFLKAIQSVTRTKWKGPNCI